MDRGSKATAQRGPWKPEEDLLLKRYIEIHGEGKWSMVSKRSGLMRGGKSCRLRWKNYLRPGLKRGEMSSDEEDLIIRMHKLLGNRWSLIAGRLPGRTDNEVKNYFYTHLRKRPSKKETVGSQSKKMRLNHPENQPQNTTDDSFEESLLDNITDEGDARITVPDRKDDIKSFLCDTPYMQYTEDKPFQPSVNPSLWLESYGHNIDANWAENLIFSTEEIYPYML